MEYCLAYITTKDKAEARQIGTVLVEKQLAACVNILEGMESIYSWEGKMECSQECVLIAKTIRKKSTDLVTIVKQHHSYTVPCIIFFEVKGGNADYLQWITNSIGEPDHA